MGLVPRASLLFQLVQDNVWPAVGKEATHGTFSSVLPVYLFQVKNLGK